MNSSFVLPLIVFGEGTFNVRITLEIQAQHPVISSTEYMIALGGKVIPPFNLSLDERHGLNIPTQDIEVIYIIRNAVYVIEKGSIIKNDMFDSWLEDAMISMNVRYGTLAPMAMYPIGSLGNEYKVITYCQILGKCFISITTLPDITVEVKVALPETRKSNRKIEVTFHNTKYVSGETILFEISGNYTAILECACDLTGTYISSNGTIAVFTGGRDTVVKRGKTKNTLITQMLPLSTWGKEFILIDSDTDDFGDTIRVISRYNNTVVKMDGFKTVTIHAMSYFIIQRSLQRGSTIYLSANKPVMVCQIAADGFKQPAMINIPPAAHYFTTELSIPCKTQYRMHIVVNGYDETFQLKERTERHIKLVSQSGFSVMQFESTDTNAICAIQNNGISFAVSYKNMTSNDYIDFNYVGNNAMQIEDVDTNTLPKKQNNSEEINDTTEDICIDSDDTTSSHGYCFIVPFMTTWNDDFYELAILPENNSTDISDYINGTIMGTTSYPYRGKINGQDMTVIKITSADKISINFLWYSKVANQAISTLLFPIDVLGLEYYAATYCPQNVYCSSYCVITAIFDNTNVKVLFEDIHYSINITEFGNNDYNVHNTSRINISIGKYKYALIKSDRDLTGTYIWADNRVSVICGASFNNTSVAEQLYPVQFFKSGSYPINFRLDEDYIANYNIRIMTSSWVTSCNLIISESLCYFEWEIYLDKPGHFQKISKGEIYNLEKISCDQPVFVWVTVINNAGSGFMVIIPSTDHILDTYDFKTFQKINGDISEHRLYAYGSSLNTTFELYSDVNTDMLDCSLPITLQQNTTYQAILNSNVDDHVLWYGGNYKGQAFGSCVGMKFSKEENCILHETEDPDCDGLIHEEMCTLVGYNLVPENHLLYSDRYIADYDLDGNYDEDCAFTLPECHAPKIENGGVHNISQRNTHVTSNLSGLYCDWGYTAAKDVESITCEADSTWRPNFICQKDCIDPVTVYNNSVIKHNTSWAAGGNVTMRCDDGYTLVGNDVIICQNNSKWQKEIFLCAKDCADPETVYNNSYIEQNTSWAAGGNVTMGCDGDHTLFGASVIVCLNNSKWQEDIFTCAEDCIDPVTDYNNSVIKHNTSWAAGGNVTMRCDDGYTLVGNDVIICQNNSKWQKEIFLCAKDCADPKTVYNNSYIEQNTSWAAGGNVTMGCYGDYTLFGSSVIVCLNNSKWQEDIFTCAEGCIDPTTENAYIVNYKEETMFQYGMTIQLQCNSGNTLTPKYSYGEITCERSGNWSKQITCIPDCPDPRTALHAPHAMVRGFTDQSSKAFGISYEFRCRIFYTMYGDGRIECLANSTWSQINFECKTCKCPCRKVGNPRYENVTKEVVQKIKDETEKDLAVQKNLTSTYVRKRKSAKDDRPAAKSIGVFGIFIITVIVAAVVASDYIILKRQIMEFYTNLRNIVRRVRR
ncbi:Hypothetical predicted protein [Mytilus galloprovincialis]|uniref:Sushi domain-containing protein n=1 Tax=Mytilus galloprovincialis TaxID=29158 RepID=A0A8B6GPK5_MYTGA|nr:Hypothetical predicted protein [Mytilus galloprovincialis]